MLRVFISYRSHDSQDFAAHIASELKNALGRETVFLASYDIPPGLEFKEALAARLATSAVLVAVIGKDWHASADGTPLWKNTEDFVRQEIGFAIENNVNVIPVLVHGAAMPKPSDLPAELRRLADYHALTFTPGPDHEVQVQRLIAAIRRAVRGTQYRNDRRRTAVRRLITAVMAVALLAIWRDTDVNAPSFQPDQLRHLLYETSWIFYEPPSKYLPYKGEALYFSTEEQIERDVKRIKESGFTGVVTATSIAVMKYVPRIAKRHGLKMIMGVWDATSHDEIYRAITQAQYVDAYWIEAGEANAAVSRQTLANLVARVRRRSRRPAALSQAVDDYEKSNPTVIGDWFFPHITLTLSKRPEDLPDVNIDRDITLFQNYIATMLEIAKPFDKGILFNKLSYPYAGVDLASRGRQSDFFCRAVAHVGDPKIGDRLWVSIVPNGAFDAPWKRLHKFTSWDPFTGLLSAEDSLSPSTTAAKDPTAIDCLTRPKE